MDKVAFLCLTYKGLVHEKTRSWLKGKPVYLNTKEPLSNTSYTVLSVPTEWAKRSIVDATLELLRVAYQQDHQWFMLLSHDVYPLVSYETLVHSLGPRSMFHGMGQNKIGTEWKTSQWWCLSRQDAGLIVERHREYDAYLEACPYKTMAAIDELYFLSCLKFLNPIYTYQEKKTVYVDWLTQGVQKHPVTYGALLEGDKERMEGSFFLRKTTPSFTSTLHTPRNRLVIKLFGDKSDPLVREVPTSTDLILVSMIRDIPVSTLNRSLRVYHTLFSNTENAIREVVDRLPNLWKNVFVMPEKASARSIQPFPYYAPLRMDTLYRYKRPKIAFLFLTIGDVHQPEVWSKYFKGFEGKYSIYSHPKFPDKVQTPWLRDALIPERVETGWGYITRAYACLMKEAMKDPENIKFVTISESCIPLKPFSSFYDYLKREDERTSYVRFMRLSQYDRQARVETQPNFQAIPSFQKHYARMCLSRYHVAKVLESPHLEFFHRMHVGDEFFLSSIGIEPDVDFVKPMEITYDNWDDTKSRLLKLKEENQTLGQSVLEKDLYRRNKALQEEIGKNPKTYTTITTEEIETALQSEAFFWRKFTADPLPWTSGLLSILPKVPIQVKPKVRETFQTRKKKGTARNRTRNSKVSNS
jgi:hypothetical protein